MNDFVHLHVHSEYSLLDGLVKISNLLDKVKELGMDTVALTDHGAMYGAFHFYKQAVKAGIKPIIGLEAYMTAGRLEDKTSPQFKKNYHLTLLAKNYQGYKNLMKLSSISHLKGFYYKPRIDFELLKDFSKDLFCFSGCMNGLIPSLLLEQKQQEAKKWAVQFMELFEDRFYLELQKHPKIEMQDTLNQRLVSLSKDLGIPLVATNDVHYIEPEDAYSQEIMLCIQTQHSILEKKRPLSMIDSPDFYLRTPSEMKGLFLDHPSAIENTIKIANQCAIEIPTGKWVLPRFPLPPKKTAEEYLKILTYERISDRFSDQTLEISQRLDYELQIICSKGYATYFLIVSDFVNWAKQQGIMVGPGRGSVAGSLVAFVLAITDINPLKHLIPFERFLNPQRPSPPDIDLDFADDRRDEVIAYVSEKYGKDKVAQIITFGKMEARAAVRDAGRALGMPYSQPDRIAKLIPQGSQGFPMTIDLALKTSSDLAQAYSNEPETKTLLDLAKKLEGIARHASVHAAGVVISDEPLTEYVPLAREPKGDKIITQYDMYSMDLNAVSDGVAIGLLKMDFLGLRNLTILEKTLSLVKEHKKIDLKLSEIPLDDKKTFDLITQGKTVGVFQLESAGMRRLGKQLKPNKFSDISAMVALYRPGPMAWIEEFIKSKENSNRIRYPHIDLKPILEPTYGIAVYQEQCMQIANIMAGYSMAEADGLRLAMGKKKKDIMEKEKKKFLAGCLQKGYSKRVADTVFSLIEKFVGYGFNIAHSTSYGMISYWTAYMKSHYGVEFMTALLTAESNGNSGPIREEKLRIAINECKRLQIPILTPDIRFSKKDFIIENETSIRFGLSAIKNVGSSAIDSILQARSKNNFDSFADFCMRTDLSKVNKRTFESLIKVGAFDSFGTRAALLIYYTDIIAWVHKIQKQQLSDQASLFTEFNEIVPPKIPKTEELSKATLLSYEKQYLGFYLTEHPLDRIIDTTQFSKSQNIGDLETENIGKSVNLVGLVVKIKKIVTKRNNSEMAFVTLEDLTGSIDLIIFPKLYTQIKTLLLPDAIIGISGAIDKKEGRISILVNSVYPLDL